MTTVTCPICGLPHDVLTHRSHAALNICHRDNDACWRMYYRHERMRKRGEPLTWATELIECAHCHRVVHKRYARTEHVYCSSPACVKARNERYNAQYGERGRGVYKTPDGKRKLFEQPRAKRKCRRCGKIINGANYFYCTHCHGAVSESCDAGMV